MFLNILSGYFKAFYMPKNTFLKVQQKILGSEKTLLYITLKIVFKFHATQNIRITKRTFTEVLFFFL